MGLLQDSMPVLEAMLNRGGAVAGALIVLITLLYFGGAQWMGDRARHIVAKLDPKSALSQQFPPDSLFDPRRHIPDLSGKVVIVTGGNAGIGFHTVKALLMKNATVYLAARSPTRCEDAVRRLRDETGGRTPRLLQLDLADLHSVRTAAREFLEKEERLDILFNNAGVMVPPCDLLTAQGYDLQFGVHVLGLYFFTKLLLPALHQSIVHHGTKARIVNTSSSGHTLAPGATGIDYTVLKGGAARDATLKKWGNFLGQWKLYGGSKIGCIMASNVLARQYGDFIVSCAVHPGGIRTDLHQHTPGWQQWLSEKAFYPAPNGALTQLWAGTTAPADKINGQYLIPWARLGKADPRADNEAAQEELLTWLEMQIKGF